MIGATLASLIIGTGGVSGAHFNPAVTLAVIMKNAYIRENEYLITFLIYFPVQFVAGIIGPLLAWGSLGRTLEIDTNDDFTTGQHLLVEIFGTFMLAHLILMTGELRQTSKLSPGLGVGTTLFLIARSIGYVSGGAYNPAVGFGIDCVDAMNNDGDRFEGTWIYFLGPLLGGVLAVLFCLLLRPACLKLYGKEGANEVAGDIELPPAQDQKHDTAH
jgi:aquaporin Z